RSASTPNLRTTVSGSMTFPRDVCICRPSGPLTHPCMRTLSYGARSKATTPAASCELNQPRVWSGPSTIQSSGHHRRNSSSRAGYPRLAQLATPLSHHTSRMSGTRRISSRHFGHGRTTWSIPGRWRSMPSAYPCAFRNASEEPTTIQWPHFVHRQIGSGAEVLDDHRVGFLDRLVDVHARLLREMAPSVDRTEDRQPEGLPEFEIFRTVTRCAVDEARVLRLDGGRGDHAMDPFPRRG